MFQDLLGCIGKLLKETCTLITGTYGSIFVLRTTSVTEGVKYDFRGIFGIIFPGITGLIGTFFDLSTWTFFSTETAGTNMSGDLANPARSIPLGSLLAALTTFVIYAGWNFPRNFAGF